MVEWIITDRGEESPFSSDFSLLAVCSVSHHMTVLQQLFGEAEFGCQPKVENLEVCLFSLLLLSLLAFYFFLKHWMCLARGQSTAVMVL